LSAQKYKKKDPVKYEEIQKVLAVTLRDKILALGPTFIKLGQLLSTRIDVLPKTYIDALAVLQDKVPGFSGDVAVQIIEEQFGKPIGDLYDTFDTTSLAAASLGQVHLATKDGKTLAVKIQRQGLKTLFDQDLKNIKVLAQLLDKFDPKSDGAARDWTTIYDESARLLYREINYKYECENGVRFGDNFKNVPWVKIPKFYPELTSEQVVTMEYVPGIKINDIEKIEAAGIDRELLSKRSAEAYLTQVCRHGFFHCDPHPGNVACDAEEGGRLIFYDFGMMDELKPEVKKGLVDLIFSIFENDYKEACNSLEEIGCLKKGVDRVSIEKIARIFLSEFKDGAKVGGKWVNQLPKEQQREIRRQRRAQLGSDLFSVGSDVPFKFPPTFTFVFRAFTSLDGIGKGLDSKYDLTRLAQPFLKELVDLRDGSATVSFLKTWGKKTGLRPVDIGHLVQSPRKVANLESIVTRMEQGDLKIRVRDLKTEQSFRRLELVQQNMALGIAASAALNVGLILSAATPAGQMTRAAQAGLAVAGVLGTQVAVGVAKVAALDKKLKSFEST
jgi:predicted unusual protein kinase regulating ubiquinone biosynthesis (AarF/ABC1/UbiB family)